MRVLLDANVLYPTVMREILLAAASRGVYQPLWSARLLEEWARAARKIGPGGETLARGEIALLRAAWPDADVVYDPRDEAALWLPDANDIHVLAAAIAGRADILLTANAKDFPARILAEHGLRRDGPDAFLLTLYERDPDLVAGAVETVRAEAEALSGRAQPIRPLLKKARLPRLGKTLAGHH